MGYEKVSNFKDDFCRFLSHFPYILNTTESNKSVNFHDKSIKLTLKC